MVTTFSARRLVFFALAFLLAWPGSNAPAQLPPPAKVIALYPGVAPGSAHWTWSQRAAGSPGNPTIQNVVRPRLLYYPADKSKFNGTAMIVAPGGGFRNLMMSYEGVNIAKRFNQMGADAFVLEYRLKYTDPNARRRGRGSAQAAPTPNPQSGEDVAALACADGQQAIRLLRKDAARFGIVRIGIIGYSAGGEVAIRAARAAPDARPDFAAAIYAAGANAAPPPAGAPPLFIAVAADDQEVGFQGAIDLFRAWRKAGLPAELHIFQTGRHGFLKKGGGADHYLDRLQEWMKLNGYLNKPAQ